MGIVLIVLYLLFAAALAYIGFAYQSGSMSLTVSATAPADDRQYWKSMTGNLKKSYFVGAIGGLLAAISLAMKKPLPAEIGCLTFMAALVFALAMLCRKVKFHPCEETEKLQKRWKLILLAASFIALLLTQQVFQFFLNLELKNGL